MPKLLALRNVISKVPPFINFREGHAQVIKGSHKLVVALWARAF